MSIYRVNLKVGINVRNNLSIKSNRSKLKLDYIYREGKYKDKDPCILKYQPNFDKLNYDSKEFFKQSENKNIVAANHTPYKEFKITLPIEFSDEKNIELAKKISDELLGENTLFCTALHRGTTGDNPHLHIMFSLKEIDYERNIEIENFLQPYKSKNYYEGGARTNKIFDKKTDFLKKSREKVADIINIELEKAGLEKISHLSLIDQYEEALKNEEYDKADRLNRKALNIDGKILTKVKYNKKLTEYEKEKYEDYLAIKEIKEKREDIYEKKKINSDIDKTEERIKKYIETQSDTIKILEKMKEVEKEIEKIDKNISNVEKSVLNKITKGEYYKKEKEYKKEKKPEKKQKLKKELSEMKNQYIKTIKFKKLKESYNKNYEKKKIKLEIEKEEISNHLKDNSLYISYRDGKDSFNYMLYQATNDRFFISTEEKNISKEEIDLENKIKKLDDLILNVMTKGDYFNLKEAEKHFSKLEKELNLKIKKLN